MAPTIVLMQTDAFRDGLANIISWFNFLIDRFGIREYLPIIGLGLIVLMNLRIIGIFRSNFEKRNERVGE